MLIFKRKLTLAGSYVRSSQARFKYGYHCNSSKYFSYFFFDFRKYFKRLIIEIDPGFARVLVRLKNKNLFLNIGFEWVSFIKNICNVFYSGIALRIACLRTLF